jgi:thiaminase (transcriptional activator TenA)
MYGGAEFDEMVQAAVAMMDSVAEGLTARQKDMCCEHFVINTKMEYMFFDAPCRHETWPC